MRGQIAWTNYRALGLTAEQVPGLIRMAVDEELQWADSDSPEVWAPLHAWRALAQLQAGPAAEPLVGLLDRIDEFNDEWVNDELPVVLSQIGEAALEPLARCLADPERGLWARVAAAKSLAALGRYRPELRDGCVAVLAGQLAAFENQSPTLNGFIVSYLVDLGAVEVEAVMARAFGAGRVDLGVVGDWEETQIQLGLLAERLTPKPRSALLNRVLGLLGEAAPPAPEPAKRPAEAGNKPKVVSQAKLETQRKAKAKAKRKQQRQTRKKSRKRT